MSENSTKLNESFEVSFLDPAQIRLAYEGENLTFHDSDGVFYPRVSLRRCFPLSSENTNILVRLPDEEMERGRELGMIANLSELDEGSQAAVQRELRLHYVVPEIHLIKSVREEFGFLYWSVETDRGPKDFIMRDSIISSSRQVSPGRWLLIDINQTRYEVADIQSLDPQSQNLLKRYLLL